MVKNDKQVVAMFGGSFDPPHLGHQRIVEKAIKSLEIDILLVVPAYLNPFKISSLANASAHVSSVPVITFLIFFSYSIFIF